MLYLLFDRVHVFRGQVMAAICICITIITLFAVDMQVLAEDNGSQGVNVESPSCILIEASTGQVLYEKNCDEAMAPASVTKVMTLLLTFEAISNGQIAYDDIVTVSEHAASMG